MADQKYKCFFLVQMIFGLIDNHDQNTIRPRYAHRHTERIEIEIYI